MAKNKDLEFMFGRIIQVIAVNGNKINYMGK